MKFITFANTTFRKPDRILQQAMAFPFTSCRGYSELDFPDFFKKHSAFIKMFPKGYGFYIWKPYIILETLKSMETDEILVYADSGCHLNANPKALQRFNEYISFVKEKHILSFSCNDYYKVNGFVKQDAIEMYFPDFVGLDDPTYLLAGMVMIRKTDESIRIIDEWKSLCEQYCFLDIYASRYYKDFPWYNGNDCDNGLYNLVIYKNIEFCKLIYPDETNVYNENGIQLAQLDNKEKIDWSPLDSFPFQARRDREG